MESFTLSVTLELGLQMSHGRTFCKNIRAKTRKEKKILAEKSAFILFRNFLLNKSILLFGNINSN